MVSVVLVPPAGKRYNSPTMDKKLVMYTQCVLKRPSDGGFLVDNAWIPSEFAKLGKVLKIKQDDNIWQDGWKVTSVGTTRNIEWLQTHERDYLHQREASDI